MLPRRPGTHWARGVTMSAAALLLAGCAADPVPIPDPGLDGDAETRCRALVDDLPADIGGRERAEVTPVDALGAAWGDPPLVLTCGTGVPDDFDRTAVCQEADGIGWYVADDELEDESLDVAMATVGHRPVVTVSVPAEERPEGVAAAMAALAGPIEEHTELVRPCV